VVSGSDDIFVAAQTVAALDLMISIDSMPAHLAGALGVRTWTLLQAQSDCVGWTAARRRRGTQRCGCFARMVARAGLV
jgi:ADP-heptose:LPS heptosyltransferase